MKEDTQESERGVRKSERIGKKAMRRRTTDSGKERKRMGKGERI